ncbi:MAG: hypothetical protein JXB34_05265 [Bacteroidales bacterium]|nr:hypothetical protein [Bacteroidales bacterium]
MKYTCHIYSKLFLALMLMFSLSSCLKDLDKEERAEEKRKMDELLVKYGFNENHKLPTGIYLKFHNDTSETPYSVPVMGQTILVTFTGLLSDGTVLETTDAPTGVNAFPDLYYVYGPHKLKKGYISRTGIDTVLHYFNPGDSATVILPSNWASYDYEPQVYHMKLLEIVENDSLYEMEQFAAFFEANGFDINNMFGNGIYYKVIGADTLNPKPFPFDENDSAIFRLTARYAESFNNGQGRVFYPLANAPDTVKRLFESTYYFPFVPAIDSALKRMGKGDTLEIAALSGYGYGLAGFTNPYLKYYIVPPQMPVHYRIELINIKNYTP